MQALLRSKLRPLPRILQSPRSSPCKAAAAPEGSEGARGAGVEGSRGQAPPTMLALRPSLAKQSREPRQLIFGARTAGPRHASKGGLVLMQGVSI
jgi:hypothetical protein